MGEKAQDEPAAATELHHATLSTVLGRFDSAPGPLRSYRNYSCDSDFLFAASKRPLPRFFIATSTDSRGLPRFWQNLRQLVSPVSLWTFAGRFESRALIGTEHCHRFGGSCSCRSESDSWSAHDEELGFPSSEVKPFGWATWDESVRWWVDHWGIGYWYSLLVCSFFRSLVADIEFICS